jgi:hypothetical protein
MKIIVSSWPGLKTQWKILVKFSISYEDHSLETLAPQKKDHGFQKDMWQFDLQPPVTSSFCL